MDGAGHFHLDLQGLHFAPSDCAAWLLEMEEDGPLSVLSASKVFYWLTGQEPPFEDALDWFQFAYTADWAADHVAPESTVLT